MPLNTLVKFATNTLTKQSGGGSGNAWANFFTLLLLSLIFLFIKVFLVHWSYNEVVPRVSQYRRLTMMEALFLVILVQTLFR